MRTTIQRVKSLVSPRTTLEKTSPRDPVGKSSTRSLKHRKSIKECSLMPKETGPAWLRQPGKKTITLSNSKSRSR